MSAVGNTTGGAPARGGRVVIVGAGIVGAACAAALVRENFDVTVVDAGCVGGGATAAGMGHIVVMDDSDAQIALTGYSQRLWDALAPELPAAGERLVCGTLWVAADAEEMQEVHRKQAFYHSCGLKAEVLDERQLYAAEKNLRPGLAGGLVVPGDSVVYPPPIAGWFLERCKAAGARVILGKRVTELTGRRVTLEDGTVLECDIAINAAGARAGALTKGIDVRPRKGHLVITDRYPGFVRHQIVELGYLKSAHSSGGDSVAFNVQPRPTGQVLIGSSRQYGDDSRAVHYPILERMIRRAVEYMPGIASLSAIRVWTGFRAATPDKLPLIGPSLDDPALFLATGHEGLGITTSLGTAGLIADQLCGRATAIPMEPYLPARLAAGAGAGVHHA